MAITFSSEANQFPDNDSLSDVATAIETWLNTLTVTTVYEISIEHVKGFYVVVAIYV